MVTWRKIPPSILAIPSKAPRAFWNRHSDHADHATEKNLAFSKELHNGIPESWIIEIIPDDMPLPEDSSDNGTFWIRRPINEDEWCATLENVLHKNGCPQWAKWTQHKSYRGF